MPGAVWSALFGVHLTLFEVLSSGVRVSLFWGVGGGVCVTYSVTLLLVISNLSSAFSSVSVTGMLHTQHQLAHVHPYTCRTHTSRQMLVGSCGLRHLYNSVRAHCGSQTKSLDTVCEFNNLE